MINEIVIKGFLKKDKQGKNIEKRSFYGKTLDLKKPVSDVRAKFIVLAYFKSLFVSKSSNAFVNDIEDENNKLIGVNIVHPNVEYDCVFITEEV